MQGRFPSGSEQLSDLNRTLLDVTPPDWTKLARVVAEAIGARYDLGDHIGDRVLQDALERLALRDPPLVEVSGDRPEMRFRKVRLSVPGRAALGAS